MLYCQRWTTPPGLAFFWFAVVSGMRPLVFFSKGISATTTCFYRLNVISLHRTCAAQQSYRSIFGIGHGAVKCGRKYFLDDIGSDVTFRSSLIFEQPCPRLNKHRIVTSCNRTQTIAIQNKNTFQKDSFRAWKIVMIYSEMERCLKIGSENDPKPVFGHDGKSLV